MWLADSTAVVRAENLACGANPSPRQCPRSGEPGGRNSRVMIARFPMLLPSRPRPPPPVSDTLQWETPYAPGDAPPRRPHLPAGTTVDTQFVGLHDTGARDFN